MAHCAVGDVVGMQPVVAEFRETFGGSADAAPAKRAPAKKRARATGGASASGGGRATKKARGGAAADDGDVVDVPAMATAGKVEYHAVCKPFLGFATVLCVIPVHTMCVAVCVW